MRIALALFLLAAPLHAERVRVVVALQEPESARAGIRAQVVGALASVEEVVPWGDGPAFSAVVDSEDLEALRNDPRVQAVAVDGGGTGGLAESLPLIGADVVHALGFNGQGTTVAVIDSGIDALHPAFAGRIAGEACFCDNLDGTGCCPEGKTSAVGTGAALDDHGHGTHVAGIVSGVAPATKLVAVKVLDAANRFRGFTQIYQALAWIANERPDVTAINMSLGSDALVTDAQCNGFAVSLGLQPVIARLRRRGVLIAASSGNSRATDRMWVPACMSEVLGVGATYDTPGNHDAGPSTTADDVAWFTNSSVSLDVLAPGVSITSTARGGGTTTMSGTSMAAPHVAGLIALIKQAGGRAFPSDAIQAILQNTGVPVRDPRNELTVPRIDAVAALAATPRAPEKPRRRASRH